MASLYNDDRTFFGVKDDTWTAIAIWANICYTSILSNANKLINLWFDTRTGIDTMVFAAIFSFFVLIGTITALKKMQSKEFLVVILIGTAWMISFLVDEHARTLLKMYYFKPVLIDGILGIICISRFSDWHKFRKIGYFFVIPAMVLFLLNAFYVINGEITEGYMTFSYNNLVIILACFWMATYKNNIILWALGVLGTIVIVITGCRGALICLGIYFVCEFFLNKGEHKFVKVLILVVLVIGYFNLENIMMNLDATLSKYDYESRTVKLFFEGEIKNDSGRSRIRDAAKEVVKEHAVLGCGMAGSSYHLYYKVENIKPVGFQRKYSHHLILDLYMDFGILGGTLFIGLLIYLLIIAYIRTKGNYGRTVLFMVASAVLPKLMLSSTYVGESLFFLLIGLLINLSEKKVKAVEEVEG